MWTYTLAKAMLTRKDKYASAMKGMWRMLWDDLVSEVHVEGLPRSRR